VIRSTDIWLQGVAIILPQIKNELNPTRVEFATMSLFIGLIVGASTWGVLADLIGRRLSFNITLFIAAVFGIAAGGANNFTTICALISCLGFGVGGKCVEINSSATPTR
jgi:MFS family permease